MRPIQMQHNINKTHSTNILGTAQNCKFSLHRLSYMDYNNVNTIKYTPLGQAIH